MHAPLPSILIVYGTGHGQTAAVARHIDGVLSARGHAVTTRHVSNPPADPVDSFDAILVGASVNYNRHQRGVVSFVETHREALESRPSGFFQLSFAAAAPSEAARAGALEWVDDFVQDTGWQPDRVGNFAGAVKYTEYSRPVKWLFTLLSAVTTGDTDTSRDYEYTDWDAVERFASEFGDLVETERGRAVPWRKPVTALPDGTGVRAALVVGLTIGVASVAYRVVRNRARATDGPRGAHVPRERDIDAPAEPVVD